MDLNALMNTMLSGDSVASMSKKTGATPEAVKSVLSAGLPALLNGAKEQASGQDTLSGFAGALANHAKADTSDLASFFSKVDLEDGGKIVAHLLGGKTGAASASAEGAGVEADQASAILSAAAPLLMSLMGQQTGQQGNSTQNAGGGLLGGLMGNLLGGADVGGLISGILGGKK